MPEPAEAMPPVEPRWNRWAREVEAEVVASGETAQDESLFIPLRAS